MNATTAVPLQSSQGAVQGGTSAAPTTCPTCGGEREFRLYHQDVRRPHWACWTCWTATEVQA